MLACYCACQSTQLDEYYVGFNVANKNSTAQRSLYNLFSPDTLVDSSSAMLHEKVRTKVRHAHAQWLRLSV
jgi:hypothetical protein